MADSLPPSSFMRALRALMSDIRSSGEGAARGVGDMMDSNAGRAMMGAGGVIGATTGALDAGANGNWVDDPNAEAMQGAGVGGLAGVGAGAGMAALAGAGRGAASARALRAALRQAMEQGGDLPARGPRPLENRMELLTQLRRLEEQRDQLGAPPPPHLQDEAAQLDMMIMSVQQQLRGL